MKFLFTTAYYIPNISGLTIHVQRLAEALAKKGHEIHVLTTQYQKSLPRREIIADVEVTRVPYLLKLSKGSIMPFYTWEAIRVLRSTDAIVINLPQLEACFVALYGRIMGKRVYCIYHCEVDLPHSFFSYGIQTILSLSHIITLLCSHRIITYTKDYATHSVLLPFFLKKVSYNYPPIPQPSKHKQLYQKLHQVIPHNTYVLGVAARVAAEKGFEYLFESVPFLKNQLDKDVTLVIAGPKNPIGEEAYQKYIQPLIEKYKKNIVFLGSISPEDMGAFYSLLDVLVLPSVNSTEAFGMVQVEAMLCGVPVVTTDLPGVRVPVQTTGMGEIARVKDALDLTEKIKKVLTQKNRYVKKQDVIARTFSFENSITTYEKIFTGGLKITTAFEK